MKKTFFMGPWFCVFREMREMERESVCERE